MLAKLCTKCMALPNEFKAFSLWINGNYLLGYYSNIFIAIFLFIDFEFVSLQNSIRFTFTDRPYEAGGNLNPNEV